MIRANGGVGPALPVLKYISTFRSGDARGAAAGWGGRAGGASRPSLPLARLVGRVLSTIAICASHLTSQDLITAATFRDLDRGGK
jgi:hypothetical protein